MSFGELRNTAASECQKWKPSSKWDQCRIAHAFNMCSKTKCNKIAKEILYSTKWAVLAALKISEAKQDSYSFFLSVKFATPAVI